MSQTLPRYKHELCFPWCISVFDKLQYAYESLNVSTPDSQPKNHSRANQERIRDLAERGRRKREEVDKSLTPVTSTGKYSDVPSKVDTNLEVTVYTYMCVCA